MSSEKGNGVKRTMTVHVRISTETALYELPIRELYESIDPSAIAMKGVSSILAQMPWFYQALSIPNRLEIAKVFQNGVLSVSKDTATGFSISPFLIEGISATEQDISQVAGEKHVHRQIWITALAGHASVVRPGDDHKVEDFHGEFAFGYYFRIVKPLLEQMLPKMLKPECEPDEVNDQLDVLMTKIRAELPLDEYQRLIKENLSVTRDTQDALRMVMERVGQDVIRFKEKEGV